MAVGAGISAPLLAVAGVKIGVAEAGIRKAGRRDLVIFELNEGTQVAGVFTRNAFCAAPVHVARRHLAGGDIRYLLVNTGNANAGTGEQGMRDAEQSCRELAALAGVRPEQVLPFSTGVIGEPLPVDRLIAGLSPALQALQTDNWLAAAEGIMTTDTRPKGASSQLALAAGTVTITGISKGAGMIKPNMATMLGYAATDARVAQASLQKLMSQAAERSFNRISVDGDTSTNDACILIATGASGVEIVEGSAEWAPFAEAVIALFVELAQAIVRDGEGATKFVTVTINGGASSDECLKAAYAIAESPLVKTALFASDPNWGRLLAAIGRSGIEQLDTGKIGILLNGVRIVERGGRCATYTEEQGQQAMAPEDIVIDVELARGQVSETVWTCDFSHEYVSINADYRS